MKKRIIKGICLLLILFNLTGCVKFNVNMAINKDKSMDFSIIYALNTEIFGEQEIFSEEDIENIKKNGFDIGTYAESTMIGVTLARKVNNIDLVSTNNNYVEFDMSGITENKQDSYLFKIDKGFFKNKYTAKIKFSSEDSGLELEDNLSNYEDLLDNNTTIDNSSISRNNNSTTGTLILEEENTNYEEMLLASMDLKFKVTLPYSALTNNATKTGNDNKTLVWTLSKDEVQYMEFQFELYNMTNIYISCAVAGLGIILLVLVIILVIKKKKKNSAILLNNSTQNNVQNNSLENVNLNENSLNNDNGLINQQVNNDEIVQTTFENGSMYAINNSVDMLNVNNNNNILVNTVSNNNSQIGDNKLASNNVIENSLVNNGSVNNITNSIDINQQVMHTNDVKMNNNIEQSNNLQNVSSVIQIPNPVNYENIVVNNNFNNQGINNSQKIINNQQSFSKQETDINTQNVNSNNNELSVNTINPKINNTSSVNNNFPGGSYIHIPGQNQNNQIDNNNQSIVTNDSSHSTITTPMPVKIDTNFSNIVNGQNQNNGNN